MNTRRETRLAAIRGALEGMVKDDDLDGLEQAASALRLAVNEARRTKPVAEAPDS